MMQATKPFWMSLATVIALACLADAAQADVRQYYGDWTYHPQYTYYFRYYYYKPTPTYVGYTYHYCIYRPATPRYIYYYNPHRQVYWGRFDVEGQPGAQYSLLEEKDRKGSLTEIPESAFPAPGAMPVIPDAPDGVQIEPPKGLPKTN